MRRETIGLVIIGIGGGLLATGSLVAGCFGGAFIVTGLWLQS